MNEQFQKEIWDSRVETTKALVKAISLSQTRPKVFVGTSAIGFYEPSETVEYTEESQGGVHDTMAKLCKGCEDACAEVEVLGVRKVVIRTGIVLGKGFIILLFSSNCNFLYSQK